MNDDDPIRAVRAEYATGDADVDTASALCHLKAEVVLAASRKPKTERNYLAALHAVADSSGRSGADDQLDKHLASAEALSDLAEARLNERGIYWAAPEFERLYVDEIAAISREFNLPYYTREAS